MNPNETRTLWISVGLAVLAMFLFYSYSQEKKAEYDSKYGAMENVVIAKTDINEMMSIDESMLDVVKRPAEFVKPNDMFLNDPEQAVGQVAAAPFKAGEPILKNKLLNPGPFTGMSLQVAPEMRAVTIPIDEIRGVGKLIKPGDRVDIIAAVDYGKNADVHKEVRTILQDVAVLATGVRIVNAVPRLVEKDGNAQDKVNIVSLTGDTSFSTITVEVSPKDAQDLVYIVATAPGGLFVTLRNPNDRTKREVPVATVDTVLRKVSPMVVSSEFRMPAAAPVAPVPIPKIVPKKKKKGPFVDL